MCVVDPYVRGMLVVARLLDQSATATGFMAAAIAVFRASSGLSL